MSFLKSSIPVSPKDKARERKNGEWFVPFVCCTNWLKSAQIQTVGEKLVTYKQANKERLCIDFSDDHCLCKIAFTRCRTIHRKSDFISIDSLDFISNISLEIAVWVRPHLLMAIKKYDRYISCLCVCAHFYTSNSGSFVLSLWFHSHFFKRCQQISHHLVRKKKEIYWW